MPDKTLIVQTSISGNIEVCVNPCVPPGFSILQTPTQVVFFNHHTGNIMVMKKTPEFVEMFAEILKVEVK